MLSRLTTRRGFRATSFAFGTILAVGAAAGPLAAQEADCTKLVGGQARAIMKTGQKDQTKCHSTANKICVGSDPCNDPDETAFQIIDKGKYAGKKTKALSKVNEAGGVCATAPVTMARFPGGALSNSLEFFDDLLANRGNYVLGGLNLSCDVEDVACFNTVAKNSAALADKMLKAAAACAEASPLVPLDPGSACITTAQSDLAGTVAGANDKIQAVCGDLGISGADIGSCTPLPDCATEGGLAAGMLAALRTFPDSDCSPVITPQGRTASVDIVTPIGLGGVEIEFDYPNTSMAIPLNGDAISGASFTNFSVSGLSFSDLDSRMRLVANDISPIASGQLVDVLFDNCRSLALGMCADDAGPIMGARGCNTDNDCKVCQNFCSGGSASGEACVVLADCPGGTCPASGNVGTHCTVQANCTGGTVCGGGSVSDAPCLYTAPNGHCSFSTFETCDADAPGACPAGESCVSASAVVPCTVTAASDTIGNAVDGVTCSVTLTEP